MYKDVAFNASFGCADGCHPTQGWTCASSSALPLRA
jgi:hypothetical protein